MTSAYEWALDTVIAFNALFILGNLQCFYAKVRHRAKSGYSYAPPFLAGLAASAAMFVHPRSAVYRLSWVPLAVDPSISIALVYAAWRKLTR